MREVATALDDLETAATSVEHNSGHVHERFGLIMLEGYSSGAIPADGSAHDTERLQEILC
jgi:hypothetical protein